MRTFPEDKTKADNHLDGIVHSMLATVVPLIIHQINRRSLVRGKATCPSLKFGNRHSPSGCNRVEWEKPKGRIPVTIPILFAVSARSDRTSPFAMPLTIADGRGLTTNVLRLGSPTLRRRRVSIPLNWVSSGDKQFAREEKIPLGVG